MSRKMVRTETSNSAASAGALMQPRACSSIRIERRRLANIFSVSPKNMTFGVMFRALQRRTQQERTIMKTVCHALIAAALSTALVPIAHAQSSGATSMTQQPAAEQSAAHDFDFLIGSWRVHHHRL